MTSLGLPSDLRNAFYSTKIQGEQRNKRIPNKTNRFLRNPGFSLAQIHSQNGRSLPPLNETTLCTPSLCIQPHSLKQCHLFVMAIGKHTGLKYFIRKDLQTGCYTLLLTPESINGFIQLVSPY